MNLFHQSAWLSKFSALSFPRRQISSLGRASSKISDARPRWINGFVDSGFGNYGKSVSCCFVFAGRNEKKVTVKLLYSLVEIQKLLFGVEDVFFVSCGQGCFLRFVWARFRSLHCFFFSSPLLSSLATLWLWGLEGGRRWAWICGLPERTNGRASRSFFFFPNGERELAGRVT